MWGEDENEKRYLWDIIDQVVRDVDRGIIEPETGLTILEELLDADSFDDVLSTLYDEGYIGDDDEVELPDDFKEFKRELKELYNDFRYTYGYYGLWEILKELERALDNDSFKFSRDEALKILRKLVGSNPQTYDDVEKILVEFGWEPDFKLERLPASPEVQQRDLEEALAYAQDILGRYEEYQRRHRLNNDYSMG